MTRTVKIRDGYTLRVPPKILTLEDGEEVCEHCRGEGEVTVCYTWNNHIKGPCWFCGGTGKVFHCSECGSVQPRGRIHHDNEWMDSLCLDCIMQDERFEQLVQKS